MRNCNCFPRAWSGDYDVCEFRGSDVKDMELASDSVVECLLAIGLPVLIRFAMDDKHLYIITAAVKVRH